MIIHIDALSRETHNQTEFSQFWLLNPIKRPRTVGLSLSNWTIIFRRDRNDFGFFRGPFLYMQIDNHLPTGTPGGVPG